MEKIWLLICVFILLFDLSPAQEQSVKEFSPVVVESNKEFFSEDQSTVTISSQTASITQNENLGYVLSRKSPLVIRNYGSYGSLTSVAMHGTGSNHTQVCWNGIPLNSPTTGQADLSLLPAGFVQSVDIINGASGSLFGSGTFGGSINLANTADWNNRISANYSFNSGSYGYMGHLLNLRIGTGKLQYQLSLLKSGADNDFYFRDIYMHGNPERQNRNNQYRDAGIVQNIYINAGKGNFIEAGVWYQEKDLQIPSLMGLTESGNARQKDSLFRVFLSYRKKGAKSAWLVRSAYLSDYINYTSGLQVDSLSYIDSKIHAGRLLNETDYRYFLNTRLIAGAGFSHSLINGHSENYGGSVSENEYAIYGYLKYALKDLILNAGLRKEFYKSLNPPPQLSAGIRYMVNKSLILRATFSTKFRKPTFNEKYWRPGGNTELRPEEGFGADAGAEWTINSYNEDKNGMAVRMTGYYQTVDNWIQWIMKDSLTPVEYKTVHARGFELWLDYSLKLQSVIISGNFNYTLNRSTIVETYDDNPVFEGNQLMYIPIHTLRSNCSFKYEGFEFDLSAHYTGERQTVESSNKSLQLPPYMLLDTGISWRKSYRSVSITLWMRCDNLFDKRYEIIRAYPVQGRTYHLGISAGFEKKDQSIK